MHRVLPIVIVLSVLSMAVAATPDLGQRLDRLESRLQQVEMDLAGAGATGGVCFLFGVFCALWAQNTNRSAWLWFFMGLFFTVITAIVLLCKNSGDREAAAARPPPGPE